MAKQDGECRSPDSQLTLYRQVLRSHTLGLRERGCEEGQEWGKLLCEDQALPPQRAGMARTKQRGQDPSQMDEHSGQRPV